MKIPGGYLLLARKMIDSDIMEKPSHYLKLWIWMLGKAFWQDGKSLKRGQFLTSISEMQKAGGYKVGYRSVMLTKDEVRSAYEAFTKATMITTAKTTRGFIITICNYEFYQDPNNYEPHNERTANTRRTPQPPHTIDEEGIRIEKNKNLKEKQAATFQLPEWVPEKAWGGFIEMRKKLKKPLTDHAKEILIKKLAKLTEQGYEPGAVLDQSTVNSWQGIFELKEQQHGQRTGTPTGSTSSQKSEYSGIKSHVYEN